jgi:tetratricopeptide (TPR) repeat protein
MKMMLAAFLLSLAPAAAESQEGGFDRRSHRIRWYPSMDRTTWVEAAWDRPGNPRMRALGTEPVDKKFIFIYVQPVTEDREPSEFINADVINASRSDWAFVKKAFDKENLHQKAWGIKTAPACIGADLFGNDFYKASGVSINTIRAVLQHTPDAVAKYEAKLKIDFQKAVDALKSDEEKATKLLVDICLAGKNGYKEVNESNSKMGEIADAAFRKGELAEAVTPETAIDYLEDVIKIYRTSPPGARAEIRIARLDHVRGNVQPAIQRLLKVLKIDPRGLKGEVDAAGKALEEISRSGEARLDIDLSSGDKAQAREAVRKIAKDYSGTELAKKALDLPRWVTSGGRARRTRRASCGPRAA